MKKYVYILLIIFSFAPAVYTVHAQTERNVLYRVAVGEFSYAAKEKQNTVGNVLGTIADVLVTGKLTQQQTQYADAVRASIVTGFGNVTRFRTIEGEFYKDEITEEENAFYVDGTVSNISTTSKTEPSSVKNKPAQQYYRSLISVTVNLKDAHTDEVTNSRTFSITDSDCSWMSTAEKAIDYSLKRLSEKISEYYNHLFPLSASIVERGEVKKEKQKEVYIDLGSTWNVYKGQQFDIFSVKTIAGKEARMEIGRLKIDKVLGEELSLCKVTRGEERVKKALDEKDTLVVISRK